MTKVEFSFTTRDREILLQSENTEMKKVVEVAFKKEVNIQILKQSEDVEEYNDRVVFVRGYIGTKGYLLTQEEFELLKKWAERVKV